MGAIGALASVLLVSCASVPSQAPQIPPSTSEPHQPGAADYDQPPQALRLTRPLYPRQAFEKHIEGTVLVEILIGIDGHVAQARVLRSVPELDSAALECVRSWQFKPALRQGKPVATIAQAPVTFRR